MGIEELTNYLLERQSELRKAAHQNRLGDQSFVEYLHGQITLIDELVTKLESNTTKA